MGKQKGKKLTKIKNKHQRETASPSPSEGGDVRGNGGMRKEGMCLTGYGRLWVGEMEGWRIGLKGCLFILNGQMFRGQKIGFLAHRPTIS